MTTTLRGSHHWSLLRPTADVPWAVDAVSAIPESLVSSLSSSSSPLAAVSCGRWHCVATRQDPAVAGTTTATTTTTTTTATRSSVPILLSVWYSHPQESLAEQKHKPNAVLQLCHEQLSDRLAEDGPSDTSPASPSSPTTLRLGMVPALSPHRRSTAKGDAVFLYALNSQLGHVFLWKLSTTDFGKPFAPSLGASCTIPLSTTSTLPREDGDEYVSAWTVAWPRSDHTESMPTAVQTAAPMILLGTSHGRLVWISQCLAPLSLRAVPVEDTRNTRRGTNSFFRLWSSSSKEPQDSCDTNDTSPIASLLVVSSTRFLAWDRAGQCGDWSLTRTPTEEDLVGVSFRRHTRTTLDWTTALGASTRTDRDADPTDAVVTVELQSASLVRTDALPANDRDSPVWTTHMILLTHQRLAFDATAPRLHWVVLVVDKEGDVSIQEHHLLDRFVDPSHVACSLVATAQGGCYAMIQPLEPTAANGVAAAPSWIPPQVTIFLCHYQGQVLELDLSVSLHDQQYATAEYSQLIGTVWSIASQEEGMTGCGGSSGIYVVTNRGLGLVIRRILPAPVSPGKRKLGTEVPDVSAVSVNQLVVHLKSHFIQYYHHQATATAIVPPSLQRAPIEALQAAVIQVASMQAENAATANHVDAFHALIDFLQDSGLYYRLPALCRHTLLTIGQQMVGYRALQQFRSISPWLDEQKQLLPSPMSLLGWLEATQDAVLKSMEKSEWVSAYLELLARALQESSSYSIENRTYKYDLLPQRDQADTVDSDRELPAWTSKLPFLLKQFLEGWKTSHVLTDTMTLQVVVASALESFRELYIWYPATSVKEQYAEVQEIMFKLLRAVKVDEELIRDICIEYRYFGGLCALAHDHEGRSDAAQFSLNTLFETLANQNDLATNLVFPEFVLRWHFHKNLLGHVFHYGQLCPDALSQLVMKEEKLRPHRWIHYTHVGDYNGAAEALVNTAIQQSRFRDTKILLGHAKLMNAIVEQDSIYHRDDAKTRCDVIEKKRELINAQELLLGGDQGQQVLLPPHRLIDLATRNFEQALTLEDKIQACVTALAVCASCDNAVDGTKMATEIWCRAISDDHILWKSLISKESNLADTNVRTMVQEETVFGGLVRSCVNAGKAWDYVRFGPVVESEVLRLLDIQDPQMQSALPRILHSAAAVQ